MESTQSRQSYFTGRQLAGIGLFFVGAVLSLLYFVDRRPSQHLDWLETTCVVDAYRAVSEPVTLKMGRIAQEYRGEYTISYWVDKRRYTRNIDAGVRDPDGRWVEQRITIEPGAACPFTIRVNPHNPYEVVK